MTEKCEECGESFELSNPEFILNKKSNLGYQATEKNFCSKECLVNYVNKKYGR